MNAPVKTPARPVAQPKSSTPSAQADAAEDSDAAATSAKGEVGQASAQSDNAKDQRDLAVRMKAIEALDRSISEVELEISRSGAGGRTISFAQALVNLNSAKEIIASRV